MKFKKKKWNHMTIIESCWDTTITNQFKKI